MSFRGIGGELVDIRHLRLFVAIVEEHSITRAAAQLFLSQPAASRQLRELERHLGCALFVRRAQGVELTEAGRELLPDAVDLLARDARITARARARQAARVRTLTIGLLDQSAAELTQLLLEATQRARPEVKVIARSVAWGAHLDQLRTGALDAVIGPRFAVDDVRTVSATLFTDARIAVLSASNPLARTASVTSRQLLELPPLITPGVPSAMRNHFLLRELPSHVMPSSGVNETFTLADGLASIATTGRYLTVSAAVERFYRHPGVVFRPVRDAPPTDVVVSMLPRTQMAQSMLRDFVNSAQQITTKLVHLIPGAWVES